MGVASSPFSKSTQLRKEKDAGNLLSLPGCSKKCFERIRGAGAEIQILSTPTLLSRINKFPHEMNGLFSVFFPSPPQPLTTPFNGLPMVIKCRFRKKRSGCRSWGNGCESVGVFRDAFLSGEQCFFRSISLKKRNRSIPRWTDQTKLSGPKKKPAAVFSFLRILW